MERHIAWGVVLALDMWADERYGPRLRSRKEISPQWFADFLGEWKVARTIGKTKQSAVRTYLNGPFRKSINKDVSGTVVDLAAAMIARNNWTHKHHQSGKKKEPISMVSKIAFFLKPSRFVPFDQYGKLGINILRGNLREGGDGQLGHCSYQDYLAEFDRWYAVLQPRIAKETRSRWVSALAKRLNVPMNDLSTRAFRRKVLDNALMRLAGR